MRYRIVPQDPHAHLFEVSCAVPTPDPDGQRFRLPVWTPGSYLIREFARHFIGVRATGPDGPVAIAKETKDCWRAAPCRGPLTVVATVYAYELSVRTAYLDASRAYFNGACVFLRPDGLQHAPCELHIDPPPGAAQRNWRVATTLPRVAVDEPAFGLYRAADYDELIDHPVEIADFSSATFEAGGVAHEVVVSGRHHGDLARLARDLALVCQWQIDFFGAPAGAPPPFDRYLFLIAVVGDGYGGLEHRASCSLLCRRDELPRAGATRVTDGYRHLLGLASHEYFHSWHVKRIQPAAFVPCDLAREAYTRELWAFEGFTSYYDDLALVRSRVIDDASYLELLGRTITAVLRTPGRHRQSVADSSFDAWIKYYRQDENTPNAVVSYYAKGALIGLALDLTLRAAGSSLDALMRTLWQRYGRGGTGVPEGAIAGLASTLAGRDLGAFFARCVDGTDDPPLAELLNFVGVRLRLRASRSGDDRGGTPAEDDSDSARPRAWLGAKAAEAGELRLQYVFSGGPAERAGLAAGDVLVAVDGLRATRESIARLTTERDPGEVIEVHAFRRDELFAASVTLESAPADTCWLEIDTAADEPARSHRACWLGCDPAKQDPLRRATDASAARGVIRSVTRGAFAGPRQTCTGKARPRARAQPGGRARPRLVGVSHARRRHLGRGQRASLTAGLSVYIP